MQVIAISVLGLVILVVLGYVFWMNFFQKDQFGDSQKQKTDTNQKAQVPANKKITTYCATGEKLCFDYPDGWSVELNPSSNGGDGGNGDNLAVTHQADSYTLKLESGFGGLGGACPDEEKRSVVVLGSSTIEKMAGFKTDYSLDTLYVARVVDSQDGAFRAVLYVTGTQEYTIPQTLSACGIMLSEFIPGRHAKFSSDSDNAGAFRFGEYGESTTFPTAAAAKQAFETTTYKEAAEILSSLRY